MKNTDNLNSSCKEETVRGTVEPLVTSEMVAEKG